jgi:hypothetical protein
VGAGQALALRGLGDFIITNKVKGRAPPGARGFSPHPVSRGFSPDHRNLMPAADYASARLVAAGSCLLQFKGWSGYAARLWLGGDR